jgi:hypothetical protein
MFVGALRATKESFVTATVTKKPVISVQSSGDYLPDKPDVSDSSGDILQVRK